MKKNNIILSLLFTSLLFTPCLTNAEPSTTLEPTPSPSSTPSVSSTPSPTPTPNATPTPSPVVEDIILSLNKDEINLDAGKSETLVATTNQENAIIEWSSSNDNIASVDQNGKVTAKDLAGSVTITAKIKDTDIEKTCTVKVTRTVSKDATLKKITLKNGTLDKTFESSNLEYKVTVDSDVNSLNFTVVETNDSHAAYLITGNEKLKNGSKVKIVVTAEDKETTRTYEFEIIKDTTSLALKSLKINGYALNEVFKADTLKYTADIPYEIDTLTIDAVLEDTGASKTINGNKNLQVGKNSIKIVVKDENGNSRTYEIIATRLEKAEVEENKTSIITSSNITNDDDNSSNNINSSNKNNPNSSDDSFLKYFIVSLACFILFLIGGIGIYFYIKTSPRRLKKELGLTNKTKNAESMENKEENKGNINSIMDEKLIETREFKQEDLLDKNNQTENLFDNNSEDV